MQSKGEILIYKAKDGSQQLEVKLENNTVWLSQKQIAALFNTQRPAITKHLSNIFRSGELSEKSVSSILEHTARDGKKYKTQFYNLDAIISVGYRVNSQKATRFRVWATTVLKDHLVKGYTLNKKRLDQVQDEKVKKSLIGLKKDDVVTLDIQKAYNNDVARIAAILKIEEDAAADLKSKFQLTVKNVNRLSEADLDQEFFDKLFGEGVVTDEAGFRAKITEELESMMVQDSERKLQDEIYHYAIDKVQFNLPDEFLKRWLRATNEQLSEEELQGGYKDFAQNLKWTLIENKIIKDNNIDIKYDEVFALAKQRLAQQFQMYSPQPIAEDQLAQYTVQYLQNKENANKIFEELKALKVFDYVKSVVTLDKKDIGFTEFNKLVAEHKH